MPGKFEPRLERSFSIAACFFPPSFMPQVPSLQVSRAPALSREQSVNSSQAWDQGSSATVPSLPGFQLHFGISSGTDAQAIKNFVSIVYIGMATGSLLSFFVNDRIGRRWSYRLYIAVWTLGQIVATLAPGLAGLYAARIITGLGIGALTVTGPMSIVEIAPAEIRGLLTAWFTVSMSMAVSRAFSQTFTRTSTSVMP